MLIALVIVGWLARDSIGQLFGTVTQTTSLKTSPRPSAEATPATPSAAEAIERARGVDDMVRRQAEEAAKRLDAPQ